jgi:hypothetical protein
MFSASSNANVDVIRGEGETSSMGAGPSGTTHDPSTTDESHHHAAVTEERSIENRPTQDQSHQAGARRASNSMTESKHEPEAQQSTESPPLQLPESGTAYELSFVLIEELHERIDHLGRIVWVEMYMDSTYRLPTSDRE